MCKIYNDMKKHDCGQRCNREEVKAFNIGKRFWNVNWNPKYNNEKLFDKENYKKLCNSQKRRIALVLNTGCNYCVYKLLNNKSNGYDSLPLPHLLLDTTKMGFQLFLEGASFHINHPIFCPRVLMSNQANEKPKSANNELVKLGCPCQSKSLMNIVSSEIYQELIRKCNNGGCAFNQYEDILKDLSNDYQSELKKME